MHDHGCEIDLTQQTLNPALKAMLDDLHEAYYQRMRTALPGIGLPTEGFLLFSPSAPLPGDDTADSELFTYLNDIPIQTTSHSYTPSGGSQFYSNYKGMFAALTAEGVPNKTTGAAILKAQQIINANPNRSPDWAQGYPALRTKIAQAPALTLGFDRPTAQFDLAGLGAPDDKITVKAAFDHIVYFDPPPGNWFVPEAFSFAFANQGDPPWVSTSSINWATTFDTSRGNLSRFLKGLFVADGIKVAVTGNTQVVNQIAPNLNDALRIVLGPIHAPQTRLMSASEITTPGHGTGYEFSSPPGVMVVIGVSVMSAADYVKGL